MKPWSSINDSSIRIYPKLSNLCRTRQLRSLNLTHKHSSNWKRWIHNNITLSFIRFSDQIIFPCPEMSVMDWSLFSIVYFLKSCTQFDVSIVLILMVCVIDCPICPDVHDVHIRILWVYFVSQWISLQRSSNLTVSFLSRLRISGQDSNRKVNIIRRFWNTEYLHLKLANWWTNHSNAYMTSANHWLKEKMMTNCGNFCR